MQPRPPEDSDPPELPDYAAAELADEDVRHTPSGARISRRLVLGGVGLAAAAAAGVVFAARRSTDNTTTPAVDSSEEPPLTGVWGEEAGFVLFTVVDENPVIDPATYSLTVGGRVRTPLTLTLKDLGALPQTSMVRDFQCVTGWRVRRVPWTGVRVRDVLSAAGADMSAAGVRFDSADGAYTETLTMDQCMRDDVLVATSMLGAPVHAEQGGPVRLYVAPMYGYKSLKWLSHMEIVDKLPVGYWEARGYDADAWVGQSNDRTDPAT